MKRFTDTDKWQNPQFKSLSTPLKVLLLYILDYCNRAGFWPPEFDVFTLRTGVQVDPATAAQTLEAFVHSHGGADGKPLSWQIKDFFTSQYPEQTEQKCNNMAKAALKELARHSEVYGEEVFILAGVRRRPLETRAAEAIQSQDGIPAARMPLGGGEGDGGETVRRGKEEAGGESPREGGAVMEMELGVAAMKLDAEAHGFEWPRRLHQSVSETLQDAFKGHGANRVCSAWRLYLTRFKGQRALGNFLDLRYFERWINMVPLEAVPCQHSPYVLSWTPVDPNYPAGRRQNKIHCMKCRAWLENVEETPPCEHLQEDEIQLSYGSEKLARQCRSCGRVDLSVNHKRDAA